MFLKFSESASARGIAASPRPEHSGGQSWAPTGRGGLRRQGLRAKAARQYKATTNSWRNLPLAENLLNQNFSAERPNHA